MSSASGHSALTVDFEVDDGSEGLVDTVLRLAEVPPLVVLLDLCVCGGRTRNQMKKGNRKIGKLPVAGRDVR